MKCSFNNRDLYITRGIICDGCVFEQYNNLDLCKKVHWYGGNYILKRSRYQSDIFKI